MPRAELTDDEAAMLNWLLEFPDGKVVTDDTTVSLETKKLIELDRDRAVITDAGRKWLESKRPFS